ncbi:Hypothetical protein SMAX5B_010701 [Scophthalmus maximus]|uniref:Uncharacterized protein n=1 Tax=Scophthalmus maximus TaxID=52904 RepID=A0A2U9C7M1_SCOMX|nr:Hypothetical protein SMAX5B_010701 [Scophthalmus maximus]
MHFATTNGSKGKEKSLSQPIKTFAPTFSELISGLVDHPDDRAVSALGARREQPHLGKSLRNVQLALSRFNMSNFSILGYIMSFNPHARCESCLGPEHAGVALTPRTTCPYCARLPLAEKQWRADAFTAMQEVDDDDSWAKRASFTVDEALEILDPSCR